MPVRYLNVGDMFIEATPAFSLSKDSELLTSWGQVDWPPESPDSWYHLS